MNSMTGFGRGDAVGDGVTWSVEVSSVNRKQLEVAPSLPRELSDLEAAVRNEVAAQCSRGRINVQIRCDSMQSGGPKVKLDAVLAEQYAKALDSLAATLGMPKSVTLSEIARWPGVLEVERSAPDAEKAWPLIEQALKDALRQLVTMRAAEGVNLKRDMEARLQRVAELLEDIRAKGADVPSGYRKALLQRLQDAGLPVDLNDERIIKEIALFADRCDISEELTRARSHLDQFAKYLSSKEAMGRNMDFLSQELFREFNTMGAKANNAELAHLVVAAKSEIEKVREQVQNVE